MNSKISHTESPQPISTVHSVNSVLNIQELIVAKIFMNENYGNKYTFLPPHITYTIMPLPEEKFKPAKQKIEKYIKKQGPYTVSVSALLFEKKTNFFYLELENDLIYEHHENILSMLNPFRGNYIRNKDYTRLENNYFDKKSRKLLLDYGFARVLNNFRTHITIGNFTVDNVNIKKLTEKLRSILNPIIKKGFIIDNFKQVYYKDSDKQQSDIETVWEKRYKL